MSPARPLLQASIPTVPAVHLLRTLFEALTSLSSTFPQTEHLNTLSFNSIFCLFPHMWHVCDVPFAMQVFTCLPASSALYFVNIFKFSNAIKSNRLTRSLEVL